MTRSVPHFCFRPARPSLNSVDRDFHTGPFQRPHLEHGFFQGIPSIGVPEFAATTGM